MDDTSVRRLGWVVHITRMQDERISNRRFLMEKSKIQDGKGSLKQGGRVLSMGMQCRSKEAKGHELGIGK